MKGFLNLKQCQHLPGLKESKIIVKTPQHWTFWGLVIPKVYMNIPDRKIKP